MVKIKTTGHKVAKAKARTPKKMKPGMARFRIQSIPVVNENNNSYMSEISFGEKLDPIPPIFPALRTLLDYMKSRVIPVNGTAKEVEQPAKRHVINGHVAFKMFYHVAHIDCDAIGITRLFQGVWKVCPDKHIWTKYADHFRSRERSDGFRSWLLSVTTPAPDLELSSQAQPTNPPLEYDLSSSPGFASPPDFYASSTPSSTSSASLPLSDIPDIVDPFLIKCDRDAQDIGTPTPSSPNQQDIYDYSMLQPWGIRGPFPNALSSSSSNHDLDFYDGNSLDTPSYIDTFITPFH